MVLPDPSLIVTVPVMGSSFALLLIVAVKSEPRSMLRVVEEQSMSFTVAPCES